MKLRNNKPSVSPDRYQINQNLVINLADTIKKPGPPDMMNQTAYVKAGGRGGFFPSTATSTTNGSSADPRRTSNHGTRQGTADMQASLKFNKNQITRLQQPQMPNTTKNAWQAVDQMSGRREPGPHSTTNSAYAQ